MKKKKKRRRRRRRGGGDKIHKGKATQKRKNLNRTKARDHALPLVKFDVQFDMLNQLKYLGCA